MLTIVTPASNRKLTTASTLADELGSVSVVEFVRMDRLIERASAMISRYCDRGFAREVLRQEFRQPLPNSIRLARNPAAVTAVAIDGVALASSDWRLDADAQVLYRVSPQGAEVNWCGWRTVVDYTAGYVLPGDPGYAAAPPDERLPADVEHACIMLCTALRSSAGRDPMLRSESTEGVGSTSWIATAEMGALPPQVADMLAPYRRLTVG
ncbi:hypothetical protein [Roseomonas sp. BN140053]|uniref:hypothetical protein n=1 Tax=Roseomonas sp. BN140053 TaxID=3391898 RepID=UPI0039EB5B02